MQSRQTMRYSSLAMGLAMEPRKPVREKKKILTERTIEGER
jgi:hypothetical protein